MGVVRFRRLVKYFIVLTYFKVFEVCKLGLQGESTSYRFVRSKFERYGKFTRSRKFVRFAKSICMVGL